MFRTLVACELIGFCCLAAEHPPKLRLSEVENIAPTSYRVDLTLDPAKENFSGSIAIAVNAPAATDTVWLNASRIHIEEASYSAGGKTLTATLLPGGEDFVGLHFPAAVPAGAGEIRIRYTAVVRPDSASVFRAVDLGNRYIFTQFESTDARGAFPCFDEPSYKTPWQLTLHIPAADSAVSNTPPATDTVQGATRTVVFRETKPLPSYLVAFAVGPFEYVPAGFAGRNHVPVRIVTPKGRAAEAKYAAAVTAPILTRLEDYFGIPYPYAKSDEVAVPVTVGFGAMENAGMVTYGMTIILAKPATDTVRRQREYAEVAAHELAHQWVGDLVTTEWWNDIWLNEAFATWMEQKIVAEWRPEWKTSIDRVDSKLFAEQQDSLITARKIRQPIKTKGDIDSAFDAITYQKGAAVIGMFERWMGPAEFRGGVQKYLRQYAFKTATADDFLNALTATGNKQVAGAFSTFLNQAGVPMVTVALDCAGQAPALRLEQSRFLPVGSKGSAAEDWQIPVCVRYPVGIMLHNECILMTQPRMEWRLAGAQSCPAWVEGNDDAKGYYRVNYQGTLLPALVAADVTARLHATERVDLLGDSQAMAQGGRLPAADALGLVSVFHADPERDVVERALDVALWPHDHLVPKEAMPNYQRFLLKNFQARAHALGWVPKPNEPDDVRLLRPDLVGAVATYGGDQALAKEAEQLTARWFQDRSAVSPDVESAVLNTAAYYGDVALFRRFFAVFQKTESPQVKQRLLGAMTSFRDPGAVQAGMQAVLSGAVPMTDGYPLLLGAGQNSPATRKLPFEFLEAHFDQLMKGHPSIFGFDLGSFLPRVGSGFCDTQSRNEFEKFFAPRVARYEGATRTFAQVSEGIDLCIAGKTVEGPSVASFLKKY